MATLAELREFRRLSRQMLYRPYYSTYERNSAENRGIRIWQDAHHVTNEPPNDDDHERFLALLQSITGNDMERAKKHFAFGLALRARDPMRGVPSWNRADPSLRIMMQAWHEMWHECLHCGSWHLKKSNSFYADLVTGRRSDSLVEGQTQFVCADCATSLYRWSRRMRIYVQRTEWDSSIHSEERETIMGYSSDVLEYFDGFLTMPNEKTKLFMGVELEVERQGSAHDVNRIMNAGKFGLLKSDGSLNNGYEIVTVPATFAYHTSPDAPWREMLQKAIDGGSRSFKRSTTGVHIHVSRAALSPLLIGKLIVFINAKSNEDFLCALAGRNLAAHTYCKLLPGKKVKDMRNTRGSQEGRYEAVNLENAKTIELRIFKGNLRYEALMRYIEFTHALIGYLDTVSAGSLFACTPFIEWVEKQGRALYPNLIGWMIGRGYLKARPKTTLAGPAYVRDEKHGGCMEQLVSANHVADDEDDSDEDMYGESEDD